MSFKTKAEQAAYDAAYRKTERGREVRRASAKRLYEKAKSEGTCITNGCHAPAEYAELCADHRRLRNHYQAEQRLRKGR